MKFRLGLLLMSFALALQAQMQMNVQELADFVRSELALKQHTDKQIAAYLKKIQLTEKLTDKTVTDLVAQGAGPKTEEALHALCMQTASIKHSPASDVTYSPATAPDNTLTAAPSTAETGRSSTACSAAGLRSPATDTRFHEAVCAHLFAEPAELHLCKS